MLNKMKGHLMKHAGEVPTEKQKMMLKVRQAPFKAKFARAI